MLLVGVMSWLSFAVFGLLFVVWGLLLFSCGFVSAWCVVVVACYSLCVGRCAGVCCLLPDGCCLLVV